MSTQNLLVELFVEELPPKALNKLGEAFSTTLFESLKAHGLASADAVVTRLRLAAPPCRTCHPGRCTGGRQAAAAEIDAGERGPDAEGQASPALHQEAGLAGPGCLESCRN
jgi:glycyl-tRNA synthetase beta chain